MNIMLEFIKNIQIWLKKIPTWLGVLLLVITITSLSVKSFTIFRTKFVELNSENTASLVDVDSTNLSLFETYNNPRITHIEKDILRKKIKILSIQKARYMSLLILLYKNYYALLSLFPFLTGLSGVLVFFIMQNGWKSSNPYFKAMFMTLAFLSAITGIFPEVYQQKENISRYTNLHTKLSFIQKDILNYNLTAPYIGKDSLNFNNFLIKINEAEKELIDIRIGLEQKEITKDIFEINK